MIESACIFCLIWTISTNYRPENKTLIGRDLLEKIKGYFKSYKTPENNSDASFIKVFNLKKSSK